MRRTLDECARAKEGLEPDAVHDLRVALRRCRSMADSLARIDPDPDWRRMKRAGRKLFRSLGDLRDAHVLVEWTLRLTEPDDLLRQPLLDRLALREAGLRIEAQKALDAFDRKEWKRLTRRLPPRAARIPEDGAVFETVALERWDEATWLHGRALTTRSAVGWHRLRIGVKRFRYVVENFLRRKESSWGEDLKRLQDLLGEVHDLDLLVAELRWLRPAPPQEERQALRQRIESERRSRLLEYRRKTTGRRSLWLRWRAELPEGDRLRAASIERLATWASFLDPDPIGTGHVRSLALELYDALAELESHEAFASPHARRVLEAASLVWNVGRSKTRKGRHKAAFELIRKLDPLPGWSTQETTEIAVVARYHRGAEPRERHRAFAALEQDAKRRVSALAGVLRLACALGSDRDRLVTRVEIDLLGDVVQVWATGWQDDADNAARVAEAKHLLERTIGRTCLVRPRARRPRLLPRAGEDRGSDSSAIS